MKKEDLQMLSEAKKATKKIAQKLISVVEKELESDANTTTCIWVYQPKAPAALDKFKKNEK